MPNMPIADQVAEYVEGGVAVSIQGIVDILGYDYDALDNTTLTQIDEVVFECEGCDYTMPVDCMADTPDDQNICNDCYPDLSDS